ncbi:MULTISPECIES: hypothetical protein [Hydrogenophaga]|uniref:Uncharacterized protein n=1 Tax=Hydrogenophaga intermedia TaxID=65786 RepID=A0A1L1PII2_HYDIT|nr:MULTISPECIES: hypothetical protein [Hydrogenophaga]AOS78551.1 hypothetical protein Q5W_06010 [Hydrogenophaga sp. PBC]TMU75125.1 hypothetical protein FGJ01_11245 [Hydrogenophaga intermedia]CDN88574.1 hypothetical protein BN948_03009 [Hydrogenophaga intermedia]
MKQFLSTLFDTVAQRLQGESRHDDDPYRLARVRKAMLALLGEGGGWEAEQLRHRVLVAESARALWFMRPDVLHWLCRDLDERAAMDSIMKLQPLFDGLVEPALLGSAAGRRDRRRPQRGA